MLTLSKAVPSHFNAMKIQCFQVFRDFLERLSWNDLKLVGYGFLDALGAFESIHFQLQLEL